MKSVVLECTVYTFFLAFLDFRIGEMEGLHFSIPDWIEENSKFFLPPVCNKLMHNNQRKVRLNTSKLMARLNNQLKVRLNTSKLMARLNNNIIVGFNSSTTNTNLL